MDAERSSYNRQCRQDEDMKRCEGHWSGRKPCCIPRSCPNPKPFVNGTVNGDHFFYPETISISCDVGHELTKDGPVYQCNETGSWVPLSGPLVKRHKTDNLRAAAELQLVQTCLRRKIIQTENFKNSKLNFARCEPVDCGKPKNPVDGQCSGNYYQFKGVAQCTCNPGFCIVGPNKTQCTSSGLWSNKAPSCKKIQCPTLSDPEHSTVQLSSEQRFVDDTAVYSCHSGYDLNMDKNIQTFTRICLQLDNPYKCEGAWSEKPPCCIPRSCPDPNNSNFRNGSIQGDAYFYPETISLNCKEGHELVGGGSYFQCNQSGQWHEISKPSDEALQRATERINSERKKVKACIFPKSNSIKTRHFPNKVKQFITCQPKYCRKPVVESNCTLVSRSFHYPSKVMFDRKYGYCVVGSNISQCNSQGLWSKASPTCKRKI
ncbi:sushi, von Willebrand factor type A, EGF and pentraxin domain-containing protein 1-like [Corticium candelabrum]|uniref:sushi, von Willebrand factor type A, EGF and pentraxin domain-containing protein 1-like n=1 Tax=Corticium candelabrum TaxID=121492 RepID=UPI002E254B79|nr:sushi, von Willebrand factor type A, EGF and pentraxin domain-containing protein 1-like [Corticium candelabrum]